jgi:putative tricarboxylic transport membrane protein
MRVNDTLTGLLLLLFGTAVVVHARTFPSPAAQSVGPGVFPILVGGGVALCGVVLLWMGRRQRGSAPVELEAWVRQPRHALNASLVICALIFYSVAAETVGFFLTAFVILAVLFLAFDVNRRWIAPMAAAVTLGLHFAFHTLLRVPLPWGWLEGIAW